MIWGGLGKGALRSTTFRVGLPMAPENTFGKIYEGVLAKPPTPLPPFCSLTMNSPRTNPPLLVPLALRREGGVWPGGIPQHDVCICERV